MNKKRLIRLTAFAVMAAGIMQVFVMTMHPAFKNNDSPETAAASVTLSIGHPPGYPLFSTLGKLFTLLPAGNYAFRVNLLSVFLAIMVLYITGLILPLITRNPGKERDLIILFTATGLSFSYIFWDQAIEAKGGIYMLNLFFFSACLYFSMRLAAGYTARSFYMLSFLAGLSLSNHWPSMIVAFPVLFAPVLLKFRGTRPEHYALAAALFFIGITPYLYLPIRAAGGAVLNWGDPQTLKSFLWVLLRQGYSHQPVAPSLEVFAYHIKEFFFMVFNNYSVLWLAALAGFFLGFKNKRPYAYMAAGVFLIYFIALVFINRTEKSIIYLMHIFMLPAEYILILVSAAALAEMRAEKKVRYAVFAAAMSVAAALFVFNFRVNDNSRNFIAYDYGANILKTAEHGGVYIGDGDYNLMPVYYYQEVMKKRRDIIFTNPSFLIFDWGIRDFRRRHAPIVMKPYDADNNVKNIIEHYLGKRHVYRSSHFPRQNEVKGVLGETQRGLLVEYSTADMAAPPYFFELYSYRGVFRPYCLKVRNNVDTATWYPVCMVNQANALMQSGYNEAAAKLYIRALQFPFEKPEGNINYNLSMAYRNMNDRAEEIKRVTRAVEKGTEIIQAYERAAELYYNIGLLEKARRLFVEARARGSSNPLVDRGVKIIDTIPENEWTELALMKGNEAIVANELEMAMIAYNFLLEKGYKKAIIYRNIGVYHFKTGNYNEAIKYFWMSENETQSPDVYLYLAYTYYSKNEMKEALNQASRGLKVFPQDAALKEFYSKLAGESGNGKDIDSTDRQR